MTLELFLAALLSLDLAFVVGALIHLHRQRAIADITDMRYRDHPDRARRQSLGRRY